MKARFRKLFVRFGLAAAAMSGLILFAGTPNATAADRDDCRWKVERAERRLEDAVARHGYYSSQARHRREELREARERCYRWR